MMRFPCAYIDLSGQIKTQGEFSRVTSAHDVCVFSARHLMDGAKGCESAGARLLAMYSTWEVPFNWEEHPSGSFEHDMGRAATVNRLWMHDDNCPPRYRGRLAWCASSGYPGAEQYALLNRRAPEYAETLARVVDSVHVRITQDAGIILDWTDPDDSEAGAVNEVAARLREQNPSTPIIGNGRHHHFSLRGQMVENFGQPRDNHPPNVYRNPSFSIIHSSANHEFAAAYVMVFYEHGGPLYHAATLEAGSFSRDNATWLPVWDAELGNPEPDWSMDDGWHVRRWEKAEARVNLNTHEYRIEGV